MYRPAEIIEYIISLENIPTPCLRSHLSYPTAMGVFFQRLQQADPLFHILGCNMIAKHIRN